MVALIRQLMVPIRLLQILRRDRRIVSNGSVVNISRGLRLWFLCLDAIVDRLLLMYLGNKYTPSLLVGVSNIAEEALTIDDNKK